jgi:hypothetical protein
MYEYLPIRGNDDKKRKALTSLVKKVLPQEPEEEPRLQGENLEKVRTACVELRSGTQQASDLSTATLHKIAAALSVGVDDLFTALHASDGSHVCSLYALARMYTQLDKVSASENRGRPLTEDGFFKILNDAKYGRFICGRDAKPRDVPTLQYRTSTGDIVAEVSAAHLMLVKMLRLDDRRGLHIFQSRAPLVAVRLVVPWWTCLEHVGREMCRCLSVCRTCLTSRRRASCDQLDTGRNHASSRWRN